MPKNDSWRFINSAQTFADINSPWPLSEKINISNLSHTMSNQNFVGVKVGDVNGNAKANNFNTNTDARSNQKLVLTSDVVDFTAGQQFEARIKLAQNTGFSGVQFTMTFDAGKLTLVGINGESLDVADQNFGYTKCK